MKTKLTNWHRRWFYRVPKQYEKAFEIDCVEKNLRRFSVLPYFNIAVQVICYFIYLYVYPSVYPDKKPIDRNLFVTFTIVYILLNLAGGLVIGYLKRHKNVKNRMSLSKTAVYLHVFTYVVLEASQVAVELEISGNIYRFLATFFVVSFFPLVSRGLRVFYMTSYIIISELALAYLQGRGVPIYSYPEINLMVFLVCLVGTNVYYNSVIRNFDLHMDLIEKTQQLEYLSSTDTLTGLANRRSLDAYLKQYWKTCLRSNSSMGILMMDIDNFKKFNDTYGHQAGDECLEQVAACIKREFHRSIDMTARYGGEEFVVVLYNTPLEDGERLAEAVRHHVENLAIPHSENPPYNRVTISIGIAFTLPNLTMGYEDLLKAADKAMYEAKESGRNRIVVCADI